MRGKIMKEAKMFLGIFIIGAVVIFGRHIMNGVSTEGEGNKNEANVLFKYSRLSAD